MTTTTETVHDVTPKRRVLSFSRRKPRADGEPERRVLSFARKSVAAKEHGEAGKEHDEAGNGPKRVLSFGRRPSWGRLPKPTRQPSPSSLAALSTSQIRDVSIYKKNRDVSIGMSLKDWADGRDQSALVARIARDGVAAKSKQLVPGDSIVAVNGVPVVDYRHASEMLRAAEGVLQLVICTAGPLPDGWAAHVDKSGEAYYTHDALRLKSYAHPAAVVADMRREVMIAKAAAGAPMGLSLAQPEGAAEGVLVSHVTHDGLAARWLKAGDTLLAINDVAVSHYQDASRMLRAAEGEVRLLICTATELPDGWAAHVDKSGETYYTHDRLRLKTYSHPAAIDVDVPTSPRKSPRSASRNADPVARWHTAYHTVSLLNRLNGETERDDVQQASLASPHQAHGMLQYERV